ncbi:GTPase, G3E family [Tistlia consotensis]|uniref:GTPase, G3E family n=1 Tax=Tistlia consotensis USBA 355 TaxID=560819 RepID=A0A1Y6C840_9PROT|nr:GTP-binding protein [Tistlia consotensis]SMF48692.1 GTPase, G3E family [Tistlia consotensis USBA 355]SNR80882.1 GTPase, G3E family [Tistlia consotensis]
MVPLTLLTGFLGSGKTTLLNALLRDPAFADCGVVVNEIGAVGVDQLLVEASDDTTLVLDGGCFCCSLQDGLAEAVGRLTRARRDAGLPPFRRFLVETSGAANPLPLLQQLIGDPRLNRRVLLDGVVTLVDGILGEASLRDQPEAPLQAAVADLLVLTKSDLADAAGLDRLERSLAGLNPSAARLSAVSGDLPAERLLGLGPDAAGRRAGRWLEPPAGHPHGHDHDHRHGGEDAIVTASVELPGPLDPALLEGWLEELMVVGGAHLLRLKGVLALSDDPGRPVAVHAVQHLVHAPVRLERWPDGLARGRVTAIARGLDRATLERALGWLAAQAGGA